MSNPKFKALIVGWYGAPNVGDEGLLAMLIHRIRERGGEPIVASMDPALTTRMHGVEAIHFPDFSAVAGQLFNVDMLVYGGGGIFQDRHAFTASALFNVSQPDISAYARPALLAQQVGVPVVVWGHGIGPLHTPQAREILSGVLQPVTAISVRDEGSRALLEEIGVNRAIVVAPDPLWAFTPENMPGDEDNQRSDGKILSVVVREWEFHDDEEDWKDKLRQCVRRALAEGWTIHWLAFQSAIENSGAASDLPLIEELRSSTDSIGRDKLVVLADANEAWHELSRSHAVISMRLHCSILSIIAGRPLLGIEYDEKMAAAHDDAGLPLDYRLKLADSAERFSTCIGNLLDSEPWRIAPDRLDSLRAESTRHDAGLDSWQQFDRRAFINELNVDWLGTWMTQLINSQQLMASSVRRANALIDYRDEEIRKLQLRCEQQQMEINALSNQKFSAIESLEHERLAWEGKLIELGEIIKLRDAIIQQERHSTAARESELHELRQSLEAAARELNEVRTRYGLESQSWQEEAENRHSQISALEVKWTSAINELNASRASQIQALERHELAKHQYDVRIRQLEDQKAKLYKQFDQQVSLGKATESQLMNLKNELSTASGDIDQLKVRLQELEIELLEAKDELSSKEAYIQDKEVYIAQLLSEAAKHKVDFSSLKAQLEFERAPPTVRKSASNLMSALQQKFFPTAPQDSTADLQVPESSADKAIPVAFDIKPLRDRLLLYFGPTHGPKGAPTPGSQLMSISTRAGFQAKYLGKDQLSLESIEKAIDRDDSWSHVSIVLDEKQNIPADIRQSVETRGGNIVLLGSPANWHSFERSSAAHGSGNDSGAALPLSIAGDNETFDSYKSYAWPEGLSKRRTHVLCISPEEMFRNADARMNERHPTARLHHFSIEDFLALAKEKQAEWLASAHSVAVLAADEDLATGETSAEIHLIMSALMLEKRVLSNVARDIDSTNYLHSTQEDWIDNLDLCSMPAEDYAFISKNTWLARAEKLIQPDYPQSVSVVVLIHNNRKIIERCVSTLLWHARDWIHEIIVVDNASVDGGAEFVEQRFSSEPKVKLLRNPVNGCSSGRNLGASIATGEYIAFFDSDQWFTSPSSFAEAINVLNHSPEVGTVGWNAGWFAPGRDDLGGPISDYLPHRGMNQESWERGYRSDVGFLGTSGMFLRRELFERLDGFDTFYDPTCFEDTDICFQIKRAGLLVTFRDLSGVRHQPHQTTGASAGSEKYLKLFQRNSDYFREKWKDFPEFFTPPM